MMMEWFWAVCFLLAIFGGKFSNAQDISATLQCEPSSQKKVECEFNLYNNGDGAIFVSKWFTPLEGIRSSCLQVTSNAKNVRYDGIMIKRILPPPSSSYVQISPKRKVSVIFDLSETYSINEPGEYTVSVYIRNLYVNAGSVVKENTAKLSLKSPEVTFAITKNVSFHRPTTGEKQRMSEKSHEAVLSGSTVGQGPLDPKVTGSSATKYRKILVKDLHRAVYHYAYASKLEVMEDVNHFKTWFGGNLTNRKLVEKNYNKIFVHLEKKVMTYKIFGPKCDPSEIAYTYLNVDTVYFCPPIFNYPPMASDNHELITILVVMMHELSHCICDTEDYVYGKQDCKDLARNDPYKAVRNADNYHYFTVTTYPFNFGIDAMTVWPNGNVYIVKENFYVRLGTGTEDPFTLEFNSYPALIRGHWGNLTEDFNKGFDSIFQCGDRSYTYVTKGPNYVRYTGDSLDSGYPKPIKGNFGALKPQFQEGFDSGAHLGNSNTYVARGNKYVAYKDQRCSKVRGPSTIVGHWGNTPPSFNQRFDSMMCTRSHKTFITNGKQYIRYSDLSANKIDPGYPKDIKGQFGKPRQ